MIIYKTTNLINSKIYIGKACGRLVSDNYPGSGKIYEQAEKKYGKENFKRIIIDNCESRHDQNRKEIFWIAFYREKFGKESVYNISSGGESGHAGCKHSKETKEKMSKSHRGKSSGFKGKAFSLESRKNRSEAVKERFRNKENHPMSKANRERRKLKPEIIINIS